MSAEFTPDHHARRRERRRRVKQLRQRPLGDLPVLPTFLEDTLGPRSTVVTATAAELGPLLDEAGFRVQAQSPDDDAPLGEEDRPDPSRRGSTTDGQDDGD